MPRQPTAWSLRPAATTDGPPTSASVPVPPEWLTRGLLASASLMLLALACASAWLSYHAQVAYVLSRNGNRPSQARVWALLLDTGTAGVSLLRLHETLRGRSDAATRASLLGCIAASVTMNLLHAPSRTPGGYLVAAVPPVMYAVFLEHLLANLRGLVIVNESRHSVWRGAALWINFPRLMWSVRRSSLRSIAQRRLSALECDGQGADLSRRAALDAVRDVGQAAPVSDPPETRRAERPSRGGRGPGAKRVAFEAALVTQVRNGDLRLFSENERERNAAAYQAAASLTVPLSPGAARRYVVQALHRIRPAGAVADSPMPDVAPEPD